VPLPYPASDPNPGVGSQRLAAREALAKLYGVLGDAAAAAEQWAEVSKLGEEIAANDAKEAGKKKEKEARGEGEEGEYVGEPPSGGPGGAAEGAAEAGERATRAE